MVLGVTGFINAATKKALIQWVDPDAEETEAFDNSQGSMVSKLKRYGDNAKKYTAMALIGDLAKNQLTPDVRKSETHKFRSNVTETAMEDGSISAQHIIQRPFEITLQFEETNAGKMLTSTLQNLGFIEKTSTFDKLVDIWRRKIVVKIITEQAIYDNMVVQNMPIAQSQPFRGALKIMVDFIQLSTVSINTISYKGADEGLNKSLQARLDGGQQVARVVAATTQGGK